MPFVYSCCIKNCRSGRSIDQEVHLHSFPSSGVRFQQWLQSINDPFLSKLSKGTLQRKKRVCSKHFEPKFFRKNPVGRFLLTPTAFPTLFTDYEVQTSTPKPYKEPETPFHLKDHIYSFYPSLGPENEPEATAEDNLPQSECEESETESRFIKEDLSRVCRTCLATDCGKMFPMKNGILAKAFKEIVGENTITGWEHVCWECGARLVAALRMRRRATKAQEALMQLAEEHDDITPSHIYLIDRQQHDMTSTLSSVHIEIVNIPGTDTTISGSEEYQSDIESEKENGISVRFNSNGKKYTSFMEAFASKLLTREQQESKFSELVASEQTLPYTCSVCSRGFDSQALLDAHHSLHTDAYGEFECPICKIRKHRWTTVKRHLRSHSLEYTCRKCNFVTTSRSEAVTHCSTHKFLLKCPQCPKKFSFDTNLKRHLLVHSHKIDLACGFCGRLFNTYPSLHRHKKTKHADLLEEEVKPMMIYCDQCCLYFASDSAFKEHQKLTVEPMDQDGDDDAQVQLSSQEEKKPICKVCDATFRNFEKLKRHITLFHTSPHPPKRPCITKHVCDKCGKIFKSDVLLQQHLEVHRIRPSFFCDICKQGFHTKTNLETHVNIHTEKSPIYFCQICNLLVSSKLHFRKHLLIQRKPPK